MGGKMITTTNAPLHLYMHLEALIILLADLLQLVHRHLRLDSLSILM
jgi:hypothetical protein